MEAIQHSVHKDVSLRKSQLASQVQKSSIVMQLIGDEAKTQAQGTKTTVKSTRWSGSGEGQLGVQNINGAAPSEGTQHHLQGF